MLTTARLAYSTLIEADRQIVWKTLTDSELMQRWLGDPAMCIKVETTWQPDSAIRISGFHHIAFENRGTILCFEPLRKLSYTHLSSVSRLKDSPENYSTISFEMSDLGAETRLALTIDNFPTETILKHLDFYWRGTLREIKRIAEIRGHELA